ncbi:MAG: alpha/beta hydrolase [bacterium]|nr:alpha/beta hydrolase [bacterium]
MSIKASNVRYYYGSSFVRLDCFRVERAETETYDNWWIETPYVEVPGKGVGVLIQGGIHSSFSQLSHKVRRFGSEGFKVICLSQSGAANVRKAHFYREEGFRNFISRDREAMNRLRTPKVILYGSSLGAAASIALASQQWGKVHAVIVVNPASLMRQSSLRMEWNFLLSGLRDKVEKDFEPPPTRGPGLLNALREELFGPVSRLMASDAGLWYLERVQCPVLIYTGEQDRVFPAERLMELGERYSHVEVIKVPDFIHSDPNSEAKIDFVVTDALKKLAEKGVRL